MEREGMVLCIHGEVTAAEVDVFDREAEFVSSVLPRILKEYPTLKIVLEHVTTREAVDAVRAAAGNRLAATMTAHHLLYSRNAIFSGAKLHPHMYCLPVLKREAHRKALLAAVAEDERGLFFAGTDSAPHPRDSKVCEQGCAGIFSAASAVELYAEAFDEAGALSKLEAFLSVNGANFYGLSQNDESITIRRVSDGAKAAVPSNIPVGDALSPVVPLRAGQGLRFALDP
jgi:dihydroorotase